MPSSLEVTHRLRLPYILPSQAQKSVTHNEAIAALDEVVQLSLASLGRTEAPADPLDGERHAVGVGATGAWEGWDGSVAARREGAWVRHHPRAGWLAVAEATGALLRHDGDDWVPVAATAVERMERLGINADASGANRLVSAAPATLLTHPGGGGDGGDHRLAINRAGVDDTASVVFQTGFAGMAEMGLAGDGAFRLKVSADGAAWRDALVADPATGAVSLPGTSRPLCVLAPDDETRRSDGEALPLRAALDPDGAFDAATGGYAVLASGVYLVALNVTATGDAGGVRVVAGGRTLCTARHDGASTGAAFDIATLAAGETVTAEIAAEAGAATGAGTDSRILLVHLGA